LFDARTIGYGYVFLLSGAAGLFMRKAFMPARALVRYGLTCIRVAHGPGFALRLVRAPGQLHVSAVSSLQRYRGPPTSATLIVNLTTPWINATTEGTTALYYPLDKKVLTP
jgi:hypothetical protein